MMSFEKLNEPTLCNKCGGLGETFDTTSGIFIPCNIEKCVDGFIEDSEIKISRREIHNSSNDIDLFYSDNNSSSFS